MSSKFIFNKDFNHRVIKNKRKHGEYINELINYDNYIPIQFKLNFFSKYLHKRIYRNRCIITGRSRAVHSKVRLSRMVLKMLIGRGYLPGFKKGSW